MQGTCAMRASAGRGAQKQHLLFAGCGACYRVDGTEWIDVDQRPTCQDARPPRRRRARDKNGQVWDEAAARCLEDLFEQLFRLHDLNGDGLLEEAELIKLNEKIALLHYGEDADLGAVRAKLSSIFRGRLDPNGDPVPYQKFRAYAGEVVEGLDQDPEAQEMILEQFVAEAESGVMAFGIPSLSDESDLPFKPHASRMGKLTEDVPQVTEASWEGVVSDALGGAPCCPGVDPSVMLGWL